MGLLFKIKLKNRSFNYYNFLTWMPAWGRTVRQPSAAPPQPRFPTGLAWVHIPQCPTGGQVCRSWRHHCPPPQSECCVRPTAGLAMLRTATASRESPLSLPGSLDCIYLTRKTLCNNWKNKNNKCFAPNVKKWREKIFSKALWHKVREKEIAHAD